MTLLATQIVRTLAHNFFCGVEIAMLRVATGLTVAGIAIGLMILMLLITGLGNSISNGVSNIAFAQDQDDQPVEAATFTMENGQDVTVRIEDVLVIELKDGPVYIQMLPQFAPNHVARIKELARQEFYDGIVWHRVIDGFMAQTGDPDGRGTGGSGQNLRAEFNGIPYIRGIVGMARAQNPHSADSQFFIMFEPGRFLDGQYTAWGRVVSGMEFVDNIKKGDSAANGTVTEPDQMIRVYVLADAS